VIDRSRGGHRKCVSYRFRIRKGGLVPKLNNGPTPDLDPLTPIHGHWASEGTTVATDDEQSMRIIGTDIYEMVRRWTLPHAPRSRPSR
jgi:hypothetical protein